MKALEKTNLAQLFCQKGGISFPSVGCSEKQQFTCFVLCDAAVEDLSAEGFLWQK